MITHDPVAALQRVLDGILGRLADASEVSTTSLVSDQETENLFAAHLRISNHLREDMGRGGD